jgi:hypothetical protein
VGWATKKTSKKTSGEDHFAEYFMAMLTKNQGRGIGCYTANPFRAALKYTDVSRQLWMLWVYCNMFM